MVHNPNLQLLALASQEDDTTLPARSFPKPPAQVAPFVGILGLDLTLQFLLRFGDANLYLPKNPQGQSRIEALIGPEKTAALADADHLFQRRVPLADPWVATCLHFQGLATNEIARKLRVTDVTVRKYLNSYAHQNTRRGTLRGSP